MTASLRLPPVILAAGLMTGLVPIAPPAPANAATIGFNAEDYSSLTAADDDANYQVFNDSGALGGQFIAPGGDTLEYGNEANAPKAHYVRDLPENATYDLYARVFIPNRFRFDDPGQPNSADQNAGDNNAFHAPATFGDPPAYYETALNSNTTSNEYFWTNISEDEGGRTLNTAGETQDRVLTIAARENGLLLDAFVLSTDSDLTSSELTAAVPEPASLGLMGLGGLMLLSRKRRRF